MKEFQSDHIKLALVINAVKQERKSKKYIKIFVVALVLSICISSLIFFNNPSNIFTFPICVHELIYHYLNMPYVCEALELYYYFYQIPLLDMLRVYQEFY